MDEEYIYDDDYGFDSDLVSPTTTSTGTPISFKFEPLDDRHARETVTVKITAEAGDSKTTISYSYIMKVEGDEYLD